MQQRELRALVDDSIEDDREVYEPSYIYKKKNYKRFDMKIRNGYCKCFNINLSFGKCLVLKPYKNSDVNSCGKRFDTKCIYLTCKNKRFSVAYKNYIDDDRAFDSSMRELIKLAKINLTRTSR